MDTKRIIAEAFMNLSKKYPIDKITTQMILDESTVSRSTFYKYFHDKYEVMTWNYLNYVESHYNTDYKSFCVDITEYVLKNKEYLKKANQTNSYNSFRNFLKRITYNYYYNKFITRCGKDSLTPKETYQLSIIVESSVSVFDYCLSNDCVDSAEDISQWYIEMFSDYIKTFLK